MTTNEVAPAAFRARTAAQYLAISKSHFHMLVRAGKLPQPIKLGCASLWRREWLDEFLSKMEGAK